MTDLVITFAVSAAVSWGVLLLTMTIAQRLSDSITTPGWPEYGVKLAVVVAAINGLDLLLSQIHFFVGWLAAFVVFWILMVKWFDVDLRAAILIVIVSWVLNILLSGLLVGLIVQVH